MDDRPVPVVRVLSVRGVEYAMMSIMLWIWSAALIGILVSLINGGASFTALSFPISLLIVAVPVFAFFYIRLRKAELLDPSLRLEASKRRFSQITQILAFITCFSNLVALIAIIMEKIGGGSSVSLPKFIGSTAVVLLVAGGILTYYWFDEHKLVRR
jgi:preprotein translocase subunit SecY